MSLDKVPGVGELYIGGLISMRRYKALRKANITHVVSALALPLDRDLYANYKHLVVELDDMDDEDIIQHFATSNAFIKDGLKSGGGVLVHCAMGKSRSATLILAYMLSLSPSTTPASALETLRTVRPIVEPNPGFMKQLELYHSMGCPIDVSSQPSYQRWLYQQQVESSVACGRAPGLIRFEDEATPADTDSTSSNHVATQIRCRKCRRNLATSAYLVLHEPQPRSATQAALSSAEQAPSSSAAPSSQAVAPQCAHLFLDPLSWMRPELEQGKLDGRLECPNPRCATNVGRYAWQGARCSCGAWVVPGICLARSKVDEIRCRGSRPATTGLEGKM